MKLTSCFNYLSSLRKPGIGTQNVKKKILRNSASKVSVLLTVKNRY